MYVGCNRHFQVFFDGSNFSPSQLSLALYASLWAYDGWYVSFNRNVKLNLICRNTLNYGTEEAHNVNKYN